MRKWFCAAVILSATSTTAWAFNVPCGGSKGGISHCLGHIFVCNDSSTSQSKKNCSEETGIVRPGDSESDSGSGHASKGRKAKRP